MKKLILTFICLIGMMFSQARIGFTEKEIIQEYFYVSWNVSYGKESELRMITGSWDEITVTHAFNSYGKCILTLVYPRTNKELTTRINYYNNLTEKINNTTWYDNGLIIEMKYGEAGCYFVITQ